MLISYFSDRQPISMRRLHQVAIEDIIAVALSENFIIKISRDGEQLFQITTRGEQYRDSKQ